MGNKNVSNACVEKSCIYTYLEHVSIRTFKILPRQEICQATYIAYQVFWSISKLLCF